MMEWQRDDGIGRDGRYDAERTRVLTAGWRWYSTPTEQTHYHTGGDIGSRPPQREAKESWRKKKAIKIYCGDEQCRPRPGKEKHAHNCE